MDSTTDTVQEAALEFNPDEPTAYETGVETIERMLRDISNTTITPTSAVVDVLLDLRTILGQMDDAVVRRGGELSRAEGVDLGGRQQ